MNAPDPINQRPIVRPEYTDPRGKTFREWNAENIMALHDYGVALDLFLSDARTFGLIQYETELLRREMKE